MQSARSFVQRDLIATVATQIKASAAHSAKLSPSDKIDVMKGAQLRALVAEDSKHYWIITDGLLEGQRVPERLCFIFKDHWRSLEQPPAGSLTRADILSASGSVGTIETILFYGQSNAGLGGSEPSPLASPLHSNLLSFSMRRQIYGDQTATTKELVGVRRLADHPKLPLPQATAMGVSLAGKQSGKGQDLRHFFMFTVWQGSQPLAGFFPGTKPWEHLLAAVRASGTELAKLDCRSQVKAVVFVQGESGPEGRGIYRARLAELLDALLPAITREADQPDLPRAILLQTNKGAGDKAAPTGVELAQWDVAQSRSDTVLAGPAYQAPLVDNHHQSVIGRLVLGDLLALVYDLVCEGRRFVPLHPVRAERDGRTIEIAFQLPTQGQALAWDQSWITPSDNFGFAYDDEEHSASIEAVDIAGSSSVRVTLTGVPTGKRPKILYAQRQTPVGGWASGRGQLISPSGVTSYFHELGYAVPRFINHYCIRFEIEVTPGD